MIYIASPYSGTEEEMESRYRAVADYTARMINVGLVVYSPIVHFHHLSKEYSLPTDFNFWQNINMGMMNKSNQLFVLCIEGWKESKGVTAEIQHAISKGIPITYVGALT